MRSRRPELALTAIVCVSSIAATYAILRVIQWRIYPEPDPALIVWSTRIAMFWRAGIGLYVAAMIAIPTYLFARRDVARMARIVMWLVPAFALIALVQGLFVP